MFVKVLCCPQYTGVFHERKHNHLQNIFKVCCHTSFPADHKTRLRSHHNSTDLWSARTILVRLYETATNVGEFWSSYKRLGKIKGKFLQQLNTSADFVFHMWLYRKYNMFETAQASKFEVFELRHKIQRNKPLFKIKKTSSINKNAVLSEVRWYVFSTMLWLTFFAFTFKIYCSKVTRVLALLEPRFCRV